MTLTEKKEIEFEAVKLDNKIKKAKVKLYEQTLKALAGIGEFFGRIQGKYKWFEYWWRVTILVFVIVILLVIFR